MVDPTKSVLRTRAHVHGIRSAKLGNAMKRTNTCIDCQPAWECLLKLENVKKNYLNFFFFVHGDLQLANTHGAVYNYSRMIISAEPRLLGGSSARLRTGE